MTGTIKHLNQDKGYGFILGENGQEYFFHRSSVVDAMGDIDQLRERQAVRFEPGPGPKGPRAEKVRLI